MKEKICLLFVFVCVCFCFGACNSTIPEQESVSQEAIAFLEKYNDFFVAENAQRASLLYLDEDSIPELLLLKDGEYRLYFFDGSEVKAIDMPNAEIIASAYGPQYDFQEQEYETFYWFEYVPYKGLIRVHNGADGERHDYYLKYVNGSFITELGTESSNYTWHTFDAENEIENDGFLIQLSDLGYDQLIPCNYLYDNVAVAYENIGAVSDTKKVLDDFVNGKVDALDYVTEISDIPEDSFVMKSYKDYFDEITAGEDFWGSEEYVDFDNDGEDELIIHGYAGSCLFFDVIGDTVYKVLRTSSTTDVAYVAEFNGKRVVVRTDLTHRGRQSYRIMEFDPCCGLVDWINLYAEYEGSDYFEYRNNEITRDEFEDIVNSIQQLVSEQSDSQTDEPEITIERVDFSVIDDAGLPVAQIYYDKPVLPEGNYAYEEINAYFDEEYNSWKNSDKWSGFLEDVATGRETWGDEDMEIMPYVNICQTKVMFADDERISILQIKYRQTAGPESCSYFGHTFDLKTGKLLSLDEITDLDIDAFQAMISDALNENQDYLSLTPEQLDEPVNPPYEYYYDGEYVYIIFNEGIFVNNGCILKWNQKYGEECRAVFLNYYDPSREDWREFYYGIDFFFSWRE